MGKGPERNTTITLNEDSLDELSVYSEDVISIKSDDAEEIDPNVTKIRKLTLECRICLLDILPDQSIVRSNIVSMKNLLSNQKLTDEQYAE